MAEQHQRDTSRSLNDQFLLSMRRWSEIDDDFKGCGDLDKLTRSLDRLVDHWTEIDEDGFKVPATALRAIFNQCVHRAYGELSIALLSCESPIESAMLLALTIVGRGLDYSVFYLVDGIEYGDRPEWDTFLCIKPQAQLGEHRVDFLLTLQTVVPDFSHPKKLPDGREIPGAKVVQNNMVIECDGHDFHERTKEQARKDRARDRWLQSLGYRVYRYTGSEIWSDVFKCAHEAVTALIKEAEEA